MHYRRGTRVRVVAAAAAVGAGMLLVGAGTTPAGAHNRAHLELPDGSCLAVGSGKSVFVGPDHEELDLLPETPNPPFDEVGTSFAGWQGRTPLVSGPC